MAVNFKKDRDFIVIKLDKSHRAVLVEESGNEIVSLRFKSFAVLEVLGRYSFETVRKDHLADTVWQGVTVTYDSIAQCVREIRRALGDGDKRVLQTVPGEGYRLMARVEVIEQSRKPDEFYKPAKLSSNPILAVLPFEVLCEGDRWQPLARGIVADLVSDLTRSSSCKVLAIKSDRIETRTNFDIAEYCRERGVRWIVTGTVQCSDYSETPNLRVSANTLDATDGTVVWSRRWVQPVEHISGMQDQIVLGIVNDLINLWSGKLADLTKSSARLLPPDSLGAYENFQCGVTAVKEYTSEGFRDGVRFLETAVKLDASLAQAWTALSAAYGLQAKSASGSELDELITARMFAARKAYAQSSQDSPWACLMGAWIAVTEGDRQTAYTLLHKAVFGSPESADLYIGAATFAALKTDLYDDAKRWYMRALELKEYPPEVYHLPIGYIHFFRRDIENSLASLKLGPQNYAELLAYRAACEFEVGQKAQAKATVARLISLYPDFSTSAYISAEPFSPEKAAYVASAFHKAGLPS